MYDPEAVDKTAKTNADRTYNNLSFFVPPPTKEGKIAYVKDYRNKVRLCHFDDPEVVHYIVSYSEFLIHKIKEGTSTDRGQEEERPRLG